MISIHLLLTTITTTTTTTIYCEAINFMNYITQLNQFKIRNNLNIVEKKLKFNLITRFYETMSDDKYNDDNVDEHDDDDDDSHFLSNVEKDNKDALYTLFCLVNSTDGWYNIGTKKGV